MKTNRYVTLICASMLACLALPSDAADRMRAGQWEGTWVGAGRTRQTSNCITQADADAVNGDAKAVRAYLEKVVPPSICKISDMNISGGQIVYTATCQGKANVITTNHYGDHFDSVDSSGAKSEAKLVGVCK